MNELIKEFEEFLETENRLYKASLDDNLLSEISKITILQDEEIAEQTRVINGGLRGLPNK